MAVGSCEEKVELDRGNTLGGPEHVMTGVARRGSHRSAGGEVAAFRPKWRLSFSLEFELGGGKEKVGGKTRVVRRRNGEAPGGFL